MKKFVLLLAVVFVVSTLFGCGKKKTDESASLEGINGVMSENVVSVSEQGAVENFAGDVPVVVENADIYAEPTDAVTAPISSAEKPSTRQIQQALKNAGIYNGKIDGDLGPRTKKAIEAFQSQNSLKADGKVGAKTWKALAGFLNKSTEVENPTDAAQTF